MDKDLVGKTRLLIFLKLSALYMSFLLWMAALLRNLYLEYR